MFRPYIKRKRVLVALALANLILVYVSYISYEFFPASNYGLKIKAARIMKETLSKISSEIKTQTYYKERDIFKSNLIGVDSLSSNMTTKLGKLESKVAVTNPNFSALFIELLSKIDSSLIDVNNQDTIAVSYTGSFPGANIALLSACKALNIHPVIISSLGSSEWGANKLEMTWIDIEKYLDFNHRSVAVSLGGDQDVAQELLEETIDSLKKKIFLNEYSFINESNLQSSIDKRMDIYNSRSKNYKAYVTIGGAAASLGDSSTLKLYLPGLITSKDSTIVDAMDEDLIDEEFDSVIPVTEKFLEEHNIPVINVRNINNLCDWYDLPYEQGDYTKESMKIGSGQLYGEKKQYNTVIVWVNLMLSSIIIFWVVLSSVAQVNKKMKEINNE